MVGASMVASRVGNTSFHYQLSNCGHCRGNRLWVWPLPTSPLVLLLLPEAKWQHADMHGEDGPTQAGWLPGEESGPSGMGIQTEASLHTVATPGNSGQVSSAAYCGRKQQLPAE